LVESLEGYPDSIKFLKKNKDWNNEAPLLSDVFVVEPAYRVALENLLDNYLNYYLVNSVEDAVQAIQLLDQHKKGKANFFVLNQFNQENSPSAPQADNLIPALSVVHVDEVYKPLAQHLLGHVYIASDDTQLPEYPQGENWVIISPSGKMIRGKYTLSGGSTGLFEGNKIGRAKNLERLAEEIQELTTVTQKLKQEIADTQTKITGFNAELNDKAIDQTKQEINRLQNQITNYSYQVENFTHLNLTAAQRLSQQEEQMQQTHDDIAQTREELSQLTEVLAGITQQIREAENTFQIAEQAYNLANQEYNQIHIQQTRQQSKIDNLRQEFSFRTNQLNDLQLQIKSNKEQLQQTTVQIAETEGKLHGGDTELYELMSKKEKDEQILNEKDRLYYVLRNEIAAQESQLNQKRREKEQTETLLSHIKDQLNEMKLRLSGLKERLYVEFRVNIDDILEEARSNALTVEELMAESERIKKRLDNMGEINPTAVEAYTEMKARHDFIVAQKTDLEEAKDSLLATIEEVENTANTRFRETFDKVRENFIQVFKALFTEEDTCDLRLTDPDNVAESGIEIYAQPKGKRPSTLTQLSGGEKTLTSTAFLFAIYLIKPAPFCILDEVDAPLDDANVGKFTQMIRKFSDNSQFIIVTHNKQTMAAVDVIYGVTMQEAGVSKLVPVDFRSLN